MGAPKSPRKGSLQYWPRKRAAKFLPRVNWNNKINSSKKLQGFICYKVGMTSCHVKDKTPNSMTKDKKIAIPVTIISCPPMKIFSVRFYKNKLVIVYADKKDTWTPPGGHIEPGETYQEAVAREVMEESNMKVLYQEMIGFLDVYEPERIVRQVRSFCVVEPYGDFEKDPDGDIFEIKLIDPKDYKKYINWGEIGDHLIVRALGMYKKYKNNLIKT